MLKIKNYINGKLVAPASKKYLDVYEPASGEVYAQAADSNQKDVDKAVAAAQKAFPKWAALSVEERYHYLIEIAQGISDTLPFLAIAESKDNGKPVWLAKAVDIPRASANFRFFATAIMQYASEAHEMAGGTINYTLRQPLGVVGCISPWNLPLYLFTWKIAPALAAGNTVIAKPSEITPLTAYLLAEICMQSKLPPGVLNILHGYGHKVGAAITKHPQIKAISFTGSTRVGAEIARVAAPMFKKLSLELGGKNPNIIKRFCKTNQSIESWQPDT